MDYNTRLAYSMLKEDVKYEEDARTFAPIGNSVVGSLLSTFHKVPRQYAEAAVLKALEQLDEELDKE